MNDLILTKVIVITEKPKTKSIMWDIIESYPATLEFSYRVEFSAGAVADIKMKNIKSGNSLSNLKPHNVSRALSKVEWYEV